MLSGCQPRRWQHACYGMDSTGLVPMKYTPHHRLVLLQSCLVCSSLVCGRLLADPYSHVLVVIFYSDVRDDNVTHSLVINTWDLIIIRCPRATKLSARG